MMKTKYPVTYEGHPNQPVEGDMLVWDGSEWVKADVQNVGTSGVGVYKGLDGTTLEVRKISTPTGSPISIAVSTSQDRVVITHLSSPGQKHIPNTLADGIIPKATNDGSLEDSIISESGGVIEVQGDIIANVD